MFRRLRSDIQAVLSRDPAARNALEVMLCYPGFKAVRWHRFAHFLWKRRMRLCARWVAHISQVFTGVDIHPGAQIGERVFIDHGVGVVIGETTVIGNDVTIYQGATLGGTGKETGKRHPTIEDNVMISSGAKVLGPFTVGRGSKIGAGAVVLREVPPYSTVVGIPGRVVRRRDCDHVGQTGMPLCVESPELPVECAEEQNCPAVDGFEQATRENARGVQANGNGVDLDQVHMPDPVAIELSLLKKRIERLEKQLNLGGKHEDL